MSIVSNGHYCRNCDGNLKVNQTSEDTYDRCVDHPVCTNELCDEWIFEDIHTAPLEYQAQPFCKLGCLLQWAYDTNQSTYEQFLDIAAWRQEERWA